MNHHRDDYRNYHRSQHSIGGRLNSFNARSADNRPNDKDLRHFYSKNEEKAQRVTEIIYPCLEEGDDLTAGRRQQYIQHRQLYQVVNHRDGLHQNGLKHHHHGKKMRSKRSMTTDGVLCGMENLEENRNNARNGDNTTNRIGFHRKGFKIQLNSVMILNMTCIWTVCDHRARQLVSQQRKVMFGDGNKPTTKG